MAADRPPEHADPTRVWVLLMWEPGAEYLDDDWPIPGALLGVFATRAAALQELEAVADREEVAGMRWVSPGARDDYGELRGAGPDRPWYSLERCLVQLRGGGLPDWLHRRHMRRRGATDDR